ncbi:MAG: response regulator, partial [Synergistaceae bacterium]|nr:response regulator [Synergistaceae bacterium]
SFTTYFKLPEKHAARDSQGDAEPSADAGDGAYSDGSSPVGSAANNFAKLRGMRVLLAEDNDINQLIAVELLSSVGVDVTTADNGLEAVKALENGEYDVVLMDLQMPEMDGLTATAKIRGNPAHRDLPIIAMTAHAMAGDREVSLKSGMDDHLTKPIDPDMLFEALLRWDRRPVH